MWAIDAHKNVSCDQDSETDIVGGIRALLVLLLAGADAYIGYPYLPEARCSSNEPWTVSEIISKGPLRQIRIARHIRSLLGQNEHRRVLSMGCSSVRRCGMNSAGRAQQGSIRASASQLLSLYGCPSRHHGNVHGSVLQE